MSEVKKRRYHSPLRVEQAAASRAAALAAARELFVVQGYGATTLDQIAARAGLSKPTLFTAIGNKAAMLKTVRDVAMAGDDAPARVSERDDVATIAASDDLTSAIARTARHIADVNARYHDVHEVIRGASGADPEVAQLWATAEQERHAGAGHLLAQLVSHRATAVPRRRATDLLWLAMAPDNYHRLVDQRGWTGAAYERWLVDEITVIF